MIILVLNKYEMMINNIKSMSDSLGMHNDVEKYN